MRWFVGKNLSVSACLLPVFILGGLFLPAACGRNAGEWNSERIAQDTDHRPLLPSRSPFSIPGDLSRLADTRYPRLSEMSEEERKEWRMFLAKEPLPRRVAAWAFLQVGTPYQGGALGEGTGLDTDPMIRFDVTDCTILNLVSVSLAHSEVSSETEAIRIAGYRPGETVAFENRLHFTTDRLDVSPWFKDVTGRFRGARRHRVHLNRRRDGGRWIGIDWNRWRDVTYLPAEEAVSLFQDTDCPEVLGVGFTKRKILDDGLDMLHEGLLYRGETVVHASSRRGRVILEPFSKMVRRYDGVVFFEYR
ncbi:MAG: DUF1460 domain-containing protein [Candidatus Hydrogenedentota bacterium]|nr:MAG: DUF1460 domain-containing protein [Candidatus Hydrogenedentota bacterium]